MGPFHCSKQHSILSRRSGLEAMLRRASDIIWTVECEGGYCSQHHPCCVLGAVLYDPSLISYYIPPSQYHLVYATECQNEMITYHSGLNEKKECLHNKHWGWQKGSQTFSGFLFCFSFDDIQHSQKSCYNIGGSE